MQLFRKYKDTVDTDKTITLKVLGMQCEGCAQSIQKSLSRMHGVKDANPDFEKQQVRMKFDESKVSLEKIRGAIKKAGFIPGVEQFDE